ncbi:MAG: type II toxin-antitoxin system RelE/ParE family toxin, partial [Ruthenibacterium sp.]
KIQYLPFAVQDIDNVAQYLSQFYPSTARRVLSKMQQQIEQLPEFPEMYAVCESDEFYRQMSVFQYIVFYHVNTEKQTIDIYRVLRATWNLPEYLEDIETE